MNHLLNQPWHQITRDERYFCSELFQIVKTNPEPFIKLLNNNGIVINQDHFDIGYEVCFYRDYIYKFGYKGVKNIKKINDLNLTINGKVINYFPFKRTFDLCIFSENKVIVIEAKAQQGFETNQLQSFEEDRELIKLLLGKNLEVSLVGLHSSRYSPSISTQAFFNACVDWSQLYNIYNQEFPILLNADNLYKK